VALTQRFVVPVPASVAAGAEVDVSSFGRMAIYVDGTFVATVQIQISPDATGARWFNEGTALTTTGVVEITKPCKRLRANTTAFTSGTPVATGVGLSSTGG